MTREEKIKENNRSLEIANKALEYSKRKFCPPDDALTNYDIFNAFQEGARYADDNPKDKITTDEIWDFCSKTSAEWWQVVMDKWNTLSKEEQDRYNQYIGFNDFSDYLMNIMAGALMQLNNTGKLVYEEGSLLLEKEEPKYYDIAYDSIKGE